MKTLLALLVVVSVDQMRSEYLDRGVPGGGLERLRKGGAVYTQARHGMVPTETCPGHAAILTGRYPAEHGIVSNDWLDRSERKSVYCAEDELFGRSPRRLDSYTLGDALKAQKPGARVATVSVKDRAAIMLGGQKPDVVLWGDKKERRLTTSGYYERPSWLDGFNKKLKKKAAGDFETAAGDEAVLLGAFELLKRERLGKDDAPDILGVSFSATDYVGHGFGADTPQMDAQLGVVDKNLARLMDELDDGVGKGRWAMILTGDHGSMPTPWSERGKQLGIRDLQYSELDARIEKALQYQYPFAGKWLEAEYFPHIWLSTAAVAATGLDGDQFLRQAAKTLSAVEDVAAVYVPGDLPVGDPAAVPYARGAHPERSGDLMLLLKPDVALTQGKKGNHGSSHDLDARVPLVFYGPGFSPGKHDEPADVIDLAPTAAAALGVKFKAGKEARVLESALAEKAP